MSITHHVRSQVTHTEEAERVFSVHGQRLIEFFGNCEGQWRDQRGRAFARLRYDPLLSLFEQGRQALLTAKADMESGGDLVDRNEAAIASGRIAIDTADTERNDSASAVTQADEHRVQATEHTQEAMTRALESSRLSASLGAPPC